MLPLTLLWLFGLGVGFQKIFQYSMTPGGSASAPNRWPLSSQIARTPGRATLLLFAHPRCPCSQASVGELERLMTRFRDKATVHVLFYLPEKQETNWAHESLWRKAEAIPGVQAVLDPQGTEAAKFGALTSGQVMLYDPAGHLVFSGGITPQRGHMGDSAGRAAILGFFESGRVEVATAPVFGCALKRPERGMSGGLQ